MTINQLSIFLENRSGTLTKVLDIMKQTGIQIIASTIADTAQYGLLRIICADSRLAYEELVRAGVAVAVSDVFAISLDHRPGQAADAIKHLSEAGIGITYMYSFLFHDKGILVIRADDNELARKVIQQNGMTTLSESDLAAWR